MAKMNGVRQLVCTVTGDISRPIKTPVAHMRKADETCANCHWPGRSIGVLVRRNRSVAQIMYLLRSRHQLSASEEGGNPLTDSPAVAVVLALLKLADHPGDTVARFHVCHTPLGQAVGLNDYKNDALALRVSQAIRSELLEHGYGPVSTRVPTLTTIRRYSTCCSCRRCSFSFAARTSVNCSPA